MKPSLVLWGASGHARVVQDILALRGDYELFGFLEDAPAGTPDGLLHGHPVFRGREKLVELRQRGVSHVILAFGDNWARIRLAELVVAQGFELAWAVHPSSVVAAGVHVAAGTVVCGGAVVNVDTELGENVIVNTGATIDHGCALAPGSHVSPGAHLAGGVSLGLAAWVGIGATVVANVKIGEGAIIGAGSVVLRDVPDHVVAYGNPARVVRSTATSTSPAG